MEAGLDSILRRLRLKTGGSAGAGGGAASGGGRLQPVSCSLGLQPTGAAGAGSGPTVSDAGGGACGGACSRAAGGAGSGAGAGAASGGGRPQPFFYSLGLLPTGDAAADTGGGSGGAVAMASGMSQPKFSNVLTRVLSDLQKHMRSYIVFPQAEDLATVKADFYALSHIPNIIGAIDGTHVAFVPPKGEMNKLS
ncbi:hypothetical protein NDU88_006859 [Pleurodeles waltl]|uniref:Nuclease HARBI1 n=1 Tax=Pleurodeles waltl TaxID=8319 RepID=A0AAV7WGV2_PLEWA|nr:hypothetical protein NDU88_006859 [Pleurodeles waltl]